MKNTLHLLIAFLSLLIIQNAFSLSAVTGTVTSAKDATPIAGAYIELGNGLGFTTSGYSSVTGDYRLDIIGVLSGPLVAEVFLPGFAFAPSDPIELGQGGDEVVNVDFVGFPVPDRGLYLLDQNGAITNDAVVEICDTNGLIKVMLPAESADANGRLGINLSPGRYKLRTRQESREFVIFPDQYIDVTPMTDICLYI